MFTGLEVYRSYANESVFAAFVSRQQIVFVYFIYSFSEKTFKKQTISKT